MLPVGAGSARPIKFAMRIEMPERAEKAKRKFNSSPVLGEVPQAEGYECYNAAALGHASAWRAVSFRHFSLFASCEAKVRSECLMAHL